jgi:DNA repair exonuclease SbcCD nuclease subunit
MNLTALNDWHIGAVRAAGTTPATAYQLRQDLLAEFEDTLHNIDTDVLLNGDLFDGPDIPKPDLLRTFQILSDWVTRTGKRVIASNGNHDLSKNSTQLSSFQLLVALLQEVHGPSVTHVAELTLFPNSENVKFAVLPHVANQELFNLAMEQVPECDYLFVHCNYDNGFAVESDHSLNMSREQAEACKARFIVFGHEHQGRVELGGKVVIVGNQVPSSVSDCLNNAEKAFFQIVEGSRHLPVTWKAEGDFSEQDWRSLTDTGRFIRVTGTATATEAPEFTKAMSRFRQTAKALVITNAVRIEGVNDAEQLVMTQEEINNFNIRGALAEMLTPEENEKIDRLLAPPVPQEEAA